MKSCIYEGRVRHTRTAPVLHRFTYRVFYLYLDLDELPTLFDRYWFWSTDRPAFARFSRSDHLGDPSVPLAAAVRARVRDTTGREPCGPIRLLTHLGYFGYRFNPVSFYYCFDADDKQVDCIVAEVNNTPWGEQAIYVLPRQDDSESGAALRFSPEKILHVSPFMDMDIDYDWSFTPPGAELKVYMTNSKNGERFFNASIAMTRTEIRSRTLASVLLRFPFMTLTVVRAIYWQALRLWLKRCPFIPHPSRRLSSDGRPLTSDPQQQ